jgi:hypothetical protein
MARIRIHDLARLQNLEHKEGHQLHGGFAFVVALPVGIPPLKTAPVGDEEQPGNEMPSTVIFGAKSSR